MCGIVGSDGDVEALPIVATGFKNLEYRGYDSAGIALAENGHLAIHKQTGQVDDSVFRDAAPEIGDAATKTFCSQVATLTLLTVALGRRTGAMSAETAGGLLDGLRGLPAAIQQVLNDEDQNREVAEAYVDGEAFLFFSRRIGYPFALEGALKLKEISYDHAEGVPRRRVQARPARACDGGHAGIRNPHRMKLSARDLNQCQAGRVPRRADHRLHPDRRRREVLRRDVHDVRARRTRTARYQRLLGAVRLSRGPVEGALHR